MILRVSVQEAQVVSAAPEPVNHGIVGRGEFAVPVAALPPPKPANPGSALKVKVGNATERHTVKFHWYVTCHGLNIAEALL